MIKKTIKHLSILFLLLLLMPSLARAETRIPAGNMYEDLHLTKDKSPYVVEGDVNLYHSNLTIDPGVIVNGASIYSRWRIQVENNLLIDGRKDDPVKLTKGVILSVGKEKVIKYAILDGIDLSLSRGTSTLSNVKITNTYSAISTRGEKLYIHDSEISNNKFGITVNWTGNTPYSGITPYLNVGSADIVINYPGESIIKIRNSAIFNNREKTINTYVPNTIDARENWWGSIDGLPSNINGMVKADPWLTEYPVFQDDNTIYPPLISEKKEEICCSNVLFLPGFQASRLYIKESTILGNKENRLWEPNTNNDVIKLYGDQYGSPIVSGTYTSDIIDTALGVKNIYKNFIAIMNGMVAENKINRWIPFAYDWRNLATSVPVGKIRYPNNTEKELVKELKALSLDSKTGKVTIIAHSNGGLVAKALGSILDNAGKGDLIDKVVFVAVPQLGTPQTLLGLLHGDGQEILGGAILSSGIARKFGLNMDGAYGLLPSRNYFDKVSSSTLSVNGVNLWYDEYIRYLMGKTDGRIQPTENDTKTPAVLRWNGIDKGEYVHRVLDNWNFPAITKVLSIVGWGMPTTQAVSYSTTTSPVITKTIDGDGTVVSGSAGGYKSIYGDKTVYLNQGLINNDAGWTKTDILHYNIMESQSVRELISNIISTSTLSLVNDETLPKYMSYTKPKAEAYPQISWMTVSVHSPVDLSISNSSGEHMGLVPLKEAIPGHEDSDLMYMNNDIGGQYNIIGDEKYFTVPADDTYDIALEGTGDGTFTLQIQKFDSNFNQIDEVIYTDLPVTPLMLANTTLNPLAVGSPLDIDADGNGTIDIQIKPSKEFDPYLHIESMKVIVKSLRLKSQLENNLLKRIEKIEKDMEKGKADKIIKNLKKMDTKVNGEHWMIKDMNENSKELLLKMVEDTIVLFEKQ